MLLTFDLKNASLIKNIFLFFFAYSSFSHIKKKNIIMCVDKKNSSLFKCVRVSCEVVFVSKEI